MSTPPASSGDDPGAAIAAIVRESVSVLPAPNPALEPQLRQYLEALLVANRGINLVSRKDTLVHLARFTRECLFLASLLERDASAHRDAIGLLDIGSGGGFPGIVLKLALPQVETVLVEGTQKKARFLADVCGSLDLRGIKVIWARAEALVDRASQYHRPDMRHDFDCVTAKGLGLLRDTLDLAAPFLRDGGELWTFKGAGYESEVDASRRRLTQLGCRLQRVERIPVEQESYVLAVRRLPGSKRPSQSCD